MHVCPWSGTSDDLLDPNCLQTLIAGRKRRERERETARCLHTILWFWLGFLEYRNAMFRSVNQSCFTTASHEDPNPNLSCASAFVRQSRTFHSITCNALRTFYHMHTFLYWRNILFWIPFGSDLDLNRVCKHQSKHSIGGSTSRKRERERERCMCSFWISPDFFTLGARLRISKFV